ncbi:MAG: outer membrane beta-barrel protein [Burkholderiales bacterium]|nr:outer membrane beta-barrel protein [Burkholderiales bacterium]
MLKKIVIAATLALSASAAMAADVTPFYAGVDLGTTKVDGLDGRKTSFGGFLGYQFNENFAAEAGYRRLASYSAPGIDVDLNQAAISVLGIAPVGNGFSIYGRLGYNHIEASASGSGVKATASTSGGLFGIGAAYNVAPNVAVRAEFQRPSSDSTNFNVGVVVKF